MKKLLPILLLLSSISAFGQRSMFHSSLTLSDEQVQVMPRYPKDNPCLDQEIEIANKYIDETLSSSLLKAICIRDFEDDVKRAITDNITTAYNDERFNPVINRVRIYYDDEFNKFLHKLIQIPKVRELLFDISSNLICDVCRLYPKDFKREVVGKIKKSLAFVSTMNNHKYEAVDLNTWRGELTLLIDGKENEDIALGIEGFLIRRVITDGFTIPELTGYLEKLLKKVEAVDVSDNSDVLQSININDDLTYYVTATGNYYLANKTKTKVLPYNPETTSVQLICFTQLQCFKDKTSNMYKISYGYLWEAPGDKYDFYNDPYGEGVLLIDDTGEVIMRE